MNQIKCVVCAAGALLLAACAGGVQVTHVEHEAANFPDVFRYAAADRDLRTQIYGNPTGAPVETFNSAVVAAMQGRNGGARTHFTTAPSASARDGYRVVLAFSRDPLLSGRAVCLGVAPEALAAATDTAHLRAAFCYRERALAYVELASDSWASPSDPRLARTVGSAVWQLFPPYDPDRPNNDGNELE
ncbi:MAG: hypothetical protein ACE5LF_05100 [Alphaproteobacteria bacterium]